ncbi:MAG: citramalate synthase [Planctomycetaceae bacterium]|nr:citramalate synthase [Planctomycetales bacterium]MCB9925700.1 citramalate synthase [Planctomycetaceae bacterium]
MRSIQIYDTTLRDGTQGEGVSLSLQDKLQITQRLDEIGVDYVEGGYPLSNEKDVEYFQRVRDLGLKHAKVCAFGMTRRRGMAAKDDPGMRALYESEAPVCTVVGKTWDFHATEVLRVSLDENLAMISDSVGFLAESGREVIYDAEHFFDGWKANPEYAAKTIQAAASSGAKLVVLCDTNGGTLPEEIAAIVNAAQAALKPQGVSVGIHCHNDCDLAVANSLAAVDAGAVQVQGTINGFGERCGNADLISVMSNLAFKKKGYQVLSGQNLDHLTELSRFVYEQANMLYRNNQPFVGQSAFAHKGGMHVHAINRATESYEHMNPALVGNERRILVSELSGRSNIIALTTKHNIAEDRELMDRILAQVVEMENRGYQFEAAGGSFDLLVKKCAGHFTPHFERLKYHVEVSAPQNETVVTEATVKLKVAGELRHEVGEGDGPVNALDAALRKALNGNFPNLRAMRLVDYKVRVVNSEAGTAARIRVSIESADEHDVWGTVGVSENIIEASWIALNDAIEYKLYKDEIR